MAPGIPGILAIPGMGWLATLATNKSAREVGKRKIKRGWEKEKEMRGEKTGILLAPR